MSATIEDRRVQFGLDTRELARAAEVDHLTYLEVERGYLPPTFATKTESDAYVAKIESTLDHLEKCAATAVDEIADAVRKLGELPPAARSGMIALIDSAHRSHIGG